MHNSRAKVSVQVYVPTAYGVKNGLCMKQHVHNQRPPSHLSMNLCGDRLNDVARRAQSPLIYPQLCLYTVNLLYSLINISLNKFNMLQYVRTLFFCFIFSDDVITIGYNNNTSFSSLYD